MKWAPNLKRINIQASVITVLFFSSCGLISTNQTSSSCATNQAILQVYENSINRLCGCTEAGNTFFSSGSSMACTIKAGSTLAIYYTNLSSNHTVSVLGTVQTLLINSGTGVTYVPANTSGTFTFNDNVVNVGGNIVVTP